MRRNGWFAACAAFLTVVLSGITQAGLVTTDLAQGTYFDLNQGPGDGPMLELISGNDGPSTFVTGDTYNIAPLAQSASTAYYISSPTQVTHTFNSGANKLHGDNLLRSTVNNFVVSEQLTNLGGGMWRAQVAMRSVDANNALLRWVPTGATSPTGNFVAWRLDLGDFAAPLNKLTPAGSWVQVGTGTFQVFNEAGTVLLSNTMGANETSNASGFSGVVLVGIGGGNIANFNMAAMQMTFEYRQIPEPSALGLLGLSSMGLAFIRRRYR